MRPGPIVLAAALLIFMGCGGNSSPQWGSAEGRADGEPHRFAVPGAPPAAGQKEKGLDAPNPAQDRQPGKAAGEPPAEKISRKIIYNANVQSGYQ